MALTHAVALNLVLSLLQLSQILLQRQNRLSKIGNPRGVFHQPQPYPPRGSRVRSLRILSEKKKTTKKRAAAKTEDKQNKGKILIGEFFFTNTTVVSRKEGKQKRPDDFGSRSPVIQKTVSPKKKCYAYRTTMSLNIGTIFILIFNENGPYN